MGTTAKKSIYKSKFFTVEQEEILLPNGKKKKYDFVKRLPTVIVFPITSDYELYLISEYRTLHKKRVIEAVAGHVDSGENPLQTAKRELKEEIGLSGGEWSQLAQIEMAGSVIKSSMSLFVVKDLEVGTPDLEDGEDIILLKMSLSEAVKKVMAGEIYISSAVIGILLLDKLKREGKI